MPASYPRSDQNYIRIKKENIHRFKTAIREIDYLGNSMGGRLLLQTAINTQGDESGFHQSKSTNHEAHLTIKSEEVIKTRKGFRRRNVGHIFKDGRTEDFGSDLNKGFPYPSMDWLKNGSTVPGMKSIAYLQELKELGLKELQKDLKSKIREKLSRNGLNSVSD